MDVPDTVPTEQLPLLVLPLFPYATINLLALLGSKLVLIHTVFEDKNVTSEPEGISSAEPEPATAVTVPLEFNITA